jgi:hypothetical protein
MTNAHQWNNRASRRERRIAKMGAWGLCKDCKWLQIEPDAPLGDRTLGVCIEEQLQPFLLRVSGNSGCNLFMEGAPARAKGSSASPPTAKPQR